jgi:hypothetical protein
MGPGGRRDPELASLLEQAVALGYVFEGSAVWAVAQKAVASGKSTLTPDELETFHSGLIPALRALAKGQDTGSAGPAAPGSC